MRWSCHLLGALAVISSTLTASAQQPTTAPADALNQHPLSGAPYYEELRHLGLQPPTVMAPPELTTTPPLPNNPTSVVSVAVTSDTWQDVEPTVGSVSLSTLTYKTAVFMRYVSGVANLVAGTTTNMSSFTTSVPTVPAGYSWSGDPLLAANQTTSRLFLVASIFNGTESTLPNGIAVWHSDNGGSIWGSAVIVASYPSGYPPPIPFLDKPAITVSKYTGSNGYVFVVYVKYLYGYANNNSIYIAKSTDGGLSFSAPVQVMAIGGGTGQGRVGGPQVAVDSGTGAVHVVWVDYLNNAIQSAVSTNNGQTFAAAEAIPGAGPYLPGPQVDACATAPPFLPSGIRAFTLPTVRFNTAAGKLMAVWHEWEYAPIPNGLCPHITWTIPPTNVFYSYRDAGGWHQKTLVNENFANSDQFQPAIAADLNGNSLVSWYDTRNSSTRMKYRVDYNYLTPTGGRLMSDSYLSGFDSDPATYTNPAKFIGDYQDVTTIPVGYSSFLAGWVGIPTSGRGDIWISTAQ